MNYESIKSNLFVKVIPVKGNGEVLEKSPHRIFEDLALVYSLIVPADECIGSMILSRDFMEHFKVSEEQLAKDAMENALKLFPAYITNTFEVLFNNGSSVDLFETLAVSNLDRNGIYAISNQTLKFGAAAIFYPGVMEGLYKQLGSFFILPSSIHEVMVVTAMDLTGEFAKEFAEDLVDIVHTVNTQSVSPEEWLSGSVYLYDGNEFKAIYTPKFEVL